MVKLRICIGFCDKYTGKVYKSGDIVEFEKARADELLTDSRNLAELAEPKKKGKK